MREMIAMTDILIGLTSHTGTCKKNSPDTNHSGINPEDLQKPVRAILFDMTIEKKTGKSGIT
jgi:hypothetical protein